MEIGSQVNQQARDDHSKGAGDETLKARDANASTGSWKTQSGRPRECRGLRMKDLMHTFMGYNCTKLYIKNAQGKKMWLKVGKHDVLRIAASGKPG